MRQSKATCFKPFIIPGVSPIGASSLVLVLSCDEDEIAHYPHNAKILPVMDSPGRLCFFFPRSGRCLCTPMLTAFCVLRPTLCSVSSSSRTSGSVPPIAIACCCRVMFDTDPRLWGCQARVGTIIQLDRSIFPEDWPHSSTKESFYISP